MKFRLLLFAFCLFFSFRLDHGFAAGVEERTLRLLQEEKYEQAFNAALLMHNDGNLRGMYILGLMYYHGWGVEQNHETAARAFYTASKDGQDGGVPDAAYYLARSFYLDPESKYYNFQAGLRLLLTLKENGHKDGTFYHGVVLLSRESKADEPEKIIDWARESFTKASALGKVEADFFLFIIERDEINAGKRTSFRTIGNLEKAANNKNDVQHMAALELALLHKKGEHVAQDMNLYVEYLRKSADLENTRAALFLGRALSIGVTKDPDYDEARFYLEFAEKHGEKGAKHALKQLTQQESAERAVTAYTPPDDWFEHFLVAQAHSSLPSDEVYKEKNIGTSFSFDGWSKAAITTSSKIIRFDRIGNSIRGSDGSRYQIRGDSIRGSDGTRYKLMEQGDTIRASNGVRYKIRGNTIRGSDGTRCRMSGRTTRCF
jgi:TPR repeat protein